MIPAAPYMLVQSLLVMQQAVANAQSRISALEKQVAERASQYSASGRELSRRSRQPFRRRAISWTVTARDDASTASSGSDATGATAAIATVRLPTTRTATGSQGRRIFTRCFDHCSRSRRRSIALSGDRRLAWTQSWPVFRGSLTVGRAVLAEPHPRRTRKLSTIITIRGMPTATTKGMPTAAKWIRAPIKPLTLIRTRTRTRILTREPATTTFPITPILAGTIAGAVTIAPFTFSPSPKLQPKGALRRARNHSPGLNGAKLRAVWDGFVPKGLQNLAQGFNPGLYTHSSRGASHSPAITFDSPL